MESLDCTLEFFIPHINIKGTYSKKRKEIMKIKNFQSDTAKELLRNNFFVRLEEIEMFEESISFTKYISAEEQNEYDLLFDFLLWKECNDRFMIENEEHYLFNNL